MAIVWADSFDNYGNASHMMDGLWANVSQGVSLVTGAALGERCARFTLTGNARRYLTDDFTRAGVAFNFKLDGLPVNASHRFGLIGFRNDLGAQVVNLRITSAGRVQLVLGSLGLGAVAAATSKLSVAAGVWNHCEIIADAGGDQIQVWLNGKLALDYAGNVVGPLSEVSIGTFDTGTQNLYVTSYYDNIVAQGGAGTVSLGQVGVYYQQPIADGVPQDWQLSEGAQAWPLVDDLNPDENAGYIYATQQDLTATFDVEALPLNVSGVVAVIPIARVRKSDTGDCDSVLGVMSGDTPAESADLPALLDYSYHFAVFEKDPDDNGAWAPAPLPSIFIRRTL